MTVVTSYISQFEAAMLPIPGNYMEKFMDNFEPVARLRSQPPEDLLPVLLKHLKSSLVVKGDTRDSKQLKATWALFIATYARIDELTVSLTAESTFEQCFVWLNLFVPKLAMLAAA